MKVGVIGLGSIGKRHASNLLQLGHTVLGHDPLRDLTSMGGATHSMENLIHDCDAFVVASPTKNHHEHILKLLPTGKPILVEKPIAATEIELADLRLNAHLLHNVFVGCNLRFNPCVIQAKDWIENGQIGKPIWASIVLAQHSSKDEYIRDGVIINWGAHEVDLALHLLGPASLACAAADKSDSIADLILVHEGGARSNIHLDYLTIPEVRQTMIVGEKRTIILDVLNRSVWLRLPTGEAIPGDSSLAEMSIDYDYLDEMSAFLHGHGCPAKDGLETLRICIEARQRAGVE